MIGASPVGFSAIAEGVSSGTVDISASGITTDSPALGAPTPGQTHALTATGITTDQPTLGSPTINGMAGSFDLIAVSIEAGSPTLGVPLLSQVHVLSSADITTGLPFVGTAPPAALMVLGSLYGAIKTSYPRRPTNRQSGVRH